MSRTALALPLGLFGLAVYVMAAVAVGDAVRDTHWLIEFGYFAAAGMLWVIPARRLIFWAAGKP